MSANFLNKSGWLVGSVDLHVYFTLSPTGTPVPAAALYVVGSTHWAPSRRWRIAHSVTTDGWATLQSNWSMLTVPHKQIAVLPPHPAAQPPNQWLVTLAGTSAPTMSVSSVSGESQALLTALVGIFGFNLNCGLPSLPTGLDFNLNSVTTSPSLGDYIAGFIGMCLNATYNNAVGWVSRSWSMPVCIAIAAIQNFLDFLDAHNVWHLCDPITWLINLVTSKIQSLVDGARSPALSPATGS
jgi:hypothetical protein